MTQWRDVVGLNGKYSVSDDGQIRSNAKGKILKLNLHGHGYLQVCVKPEGRYGKAKVLKVHREVAKAFIPNESGKPTVNHIDGIKTNNDKKNLEWATYSEQMMHAISIGLKVMPKGEYAYSSKLSEYQVLDIFSRRCGTIRDIGNEFGVSHSTISRIRTGKNWISVTDSGL